MKTARLVKVTYHGIDHEQYFPGHCISHSEFTETATGIGEDNKWALEDALDNLAQNDWDTETLEKLIEATGQGPKRYEEIADWANGFWWYVSVDVKE